jgi:hypothetical protein
LNPPGDAWRILIRPWVEIILTTPLRRAIFLGGLIGAFILAMIMMMVR